MVCPSPKCSSGFLVVAFSVADEEKCGKNAGVLLAYRRYSSLNSVIASRSSRRARRTYMNIRIGNITSVTLQAARHKSTPAPIPSGMGKIAHRHPIERCARCVPFTIDKGYLLDWDGELTSQRPIPGVNLYIGRR